MARRYILIVCGRHSGSVRALVDVRTVTDGTLIAPR